MVVEPSHRICITGVKWGKIGEGVVRFSPKQFLLCLCRADAERIYELFAEVKHVSAGEYSINQQFPTDNIDDVTNDRFTEDLRIILRQFSHLRSS